MTSERKKEGRKYRTGDEVTASILNERFTTKQLVEIYKNREFRSLKNYLEPILREREGVPSRDFGRFHNLEDCELDENLIEEVKTEGIDLDLGLIRGNGVIKKIICKTHEVSSNQFLETEWGYERDL